MKWFDDPNHTSSSVENSGGSVVVWPCVAAPATDSLIFTDDDIHEGDTRMNSEEYRNILSANLQWNASKL